MTDSPGSPLSSIASDDISDRDDVKHVLSPSGSNKDITSSSNMPPSKRRRTGAASWDRNTPVSTTYQDDLPPAPASPSSSISSDTDGEIPNSPNTLALLGGSQEDDYSGQCNDQVTVCRWEGCDAGKLGNMMIWCIISIMTISGRGRRSIRASGRIVIGRDRRMLVDMH